jgi:hypothetical protein
LARLVVNLDTVVEELLIRPSVENFVICRTGIINDEFMLRGSCFRCGGLRLVNEVEPTENGTQQSETNALTMSIRCNEVRFVAESDFVDCVARFGDFRYSHGLRNRRHASFMQDFDQI